MIKWLGIGFVILGSTAMGMVMSGDLEKRVRQLKELRKMLVMIQGEIRYANAPLSEAFHHVGRRVPAPFQEFLEHVACQMEEYRGEVFSDIFARNVRIDLAGTALKKEDKEQLLRLGENLGYLDGQMQMNSIELYLHQLNETCEEASQEVRNKSKVYHCLGVMGGLFLAIIFI